MATMTFTGTLVVETCCRENCGMQFAMPEDFGTQKRRDHKTFYCPRGHGQSYTSESDLERAERLRLAARQEANDGWAPFSASQDQLQAERRSKAALKGQLTKARNKIANGVCPVGNCRRHFDNVQAHISTEHPTWHVTDPETGKAAVL